uniref:3'-5' exonuclease domain-containing protein n=1 Tax=Ditylenchus dipsaci TaxID=166011 RepID=A0A915EKV2_9BILA
MDTMDNLDAEKVIGIDTEGMPHFHSVKEQVALIQVASSTAVYLIDVIALKKVLDEKQWLTFFEIILFSDDVVTIGYDFNNDLRFLTSTFPCLSEYLPRISNVFCLYRLLSEVLLNPEACEVVFGSKTFAINLNLNEVTKLFLGIELDKSERIGNWAQRPLRLEQKRYAALDAYALIGCFRVISKRLNKLKSASILDSLKHAALMSPASNNSRPDDLNVTTKPETYEEFLSHVLDVSLEVQATKPVGTKPRTVNDTKFALDSMLFGLGKWIRICGFETKHISDRVRLIKFCEENPEFYAVSAGKAFKEIRRCLPPHQVLCVPINTQDSRSNSRQFAHLMRQLKIVINEENMYSRCVRCNKKSFCRVPKLVAKALFYTKVLFLGIDWVGISRDHVNSVLEELFDHAIKEDEFPYNGEIPEGQYAISSNEKPIICRCKDCEVDITNQLLDFGDEGAIELSMPVNSKEPFDEEFQFRACLFCGKVQYR